LAKPILAFFTLQLTEGQLTEKKKVYISNVTLARAATAINVLEYVLVAGNPDPESVSADALEALLGALFLDRGIDQANDFCERWVFGLGDDPDDMMPFLRSPLFSKPTDPARLDICTTLYDLGFPVSRTLADLHSAPHTHTHIGHSTG
jgi:hypothetical protein